MTPRAVLRWGATVAGILLVAFLGFKVVNHVRLLGLPASARPMAGALREATEAEKLAVWQRSLPNSAAKKRVYVATGDLSTVAVKTPMVVVLTRDAHHPEQVTKWIGGPLGKMVLLFEAPNTDPGHPSGHLNAILGASMHYDPICQMVSFHLASWQTCTDLRNRTSRPGEMQKSLLPATRDQIRAMAGVDAPRSVADRFRQLSPNKQIVLSPSASKEKPLLVAVVDGQHNTVIGGELGLNSLWLINKDSRVIAVFSDPLCWDFNIREGWPLARFLTHQTMTQYAQACS